MLIGLSVSLFCLQSVAAEEIVHTVKKGDTLWDISSNYLETPWKWPIVWAVNKDITNPHLIFPDDRVIISKDGEKTVIKIVRAQQPEEPVVYTPEEIVEQKENTVVLSPKYSTYIYSPTILTGPEVIKNQEMGNMSSLDDTIMIKSDSSYDADQNVSIISKVADVKRSDRTRDIAGYLYKAVAIAKVQDTKSDITRAKIAYCTQETKKGDIIFDDIAAFEPASLDISEPETLKQGRIIDLYGSISTGSVFDLIFVDLGKKQGIQKGTLLSIYKEIETGSSDSPIKDYMGMAIVLQVIDESAMCLILESKTFIEKGFVVEGKTQEP